MLSPPPVQTAVDEHGGKVAVPWVMWLGALYDIVRKIVSYAGTVSVVPVTGFSITVADGVTVLTLRPAGVLASGMITLPRNPLDGQTFECSTTQTITLLTITANTGQTVMGAAAYLEWRAGFSYYYNTATSTWFRRY